MRVVESVFRPLPPQWAFFSSRARIHGYGGAMGGGKSRCLCEWVFDYSVRLPGLRTLVCRQTHTSIVETTKKTMLEEVVPPETVKHRKESSGEDYIRLWNGSQINFVGLEDPVRWFSSELGLLVFDEAHEVLEDTVVKLITRLRQRGMPHRVALGFNPENPGHWLYKWFIEGATLEEWPADHPDARYAGKLKGYRRDALLPKDATAPIGSAEFIFARAQDNVHLPDGYIDRSLAGLPAPLRERYLEGLWRYVSGMSFFDTDALSAYEQQVAAPVYVARSHGDPTNRDRSDRPRLRPDRTGGWWVWKPPVKEREHPDTGEKQPPHRYVIAVDVSSGTANDYSAIQVVDVEEFEQVAEYQARVDPDLLAVEAARAGWVYNTALIAPEVTGGWGFSVVQALEKLKYPRLYTRRVEDRLAKQWTDRLGWDTSTATRAFMLDKLEEVVRERQLGLRSARLLTEMAAFVWPQEKRGGGPYKGVPQAQPGTNDDLVMALAIAVAVTVKLPRELRRPRETPPTRSFPAIPGY